MNRKEFESLLENLKQRFDELAWSARHSDVAPETTDVEIALGWIDCYVILTPTANTLWVDVNGATFDSLDGSDAADFFDSLFSGAVKKTLRKDGSISRLEVLGSGKQWLAE